MKHKSEELPFTLDGLLKKCKICANELPPSMFSGWERARATGKARCRLCLKKKNRAIYLRDKEKRLEKQREIRRNRDQETIVADRETNREYARRYRAGEPSKHQKKLLEESKRLDGLSGTFE